MLKPYIYFVIIIDILSIFHLKFVEDSIREISLTPTTVSKLLGCL